MKVENFNEIEKPTFQAIGRIFSHFLIKLPDFRDFPFRKIQFVVQWKSQMEPIATHL